MNVTFIILFTFELNSTYIEAMFNEGDIFLLMYFRLLIQPKIRFHK